MDGLSNTLLFGERTWEYRSGGTVYPARAAIQVMNRDTRTSTSSHGTAGMFFLGDSDTCATLAGGRCINYPHADPLQSTVTFSSQHPAGANFAIADGSVHFMRETTDETTLMNLGDIADGRITGSF